MCRIYTNARALYVVVKDKATSIVITNKEGIYYNIHIHVLHIHTYVHNVYIIVQTIPKGW